MFETNYNDEMELEVKRMEAKKRAADAGHPDWDNACASCGRRLHVIYENRCEDCAVTV